MNDDDIVTLTTPTGSDTITVSAEVDWLDDMSGQTLSDIIIDDDCEAFTIPTNYDSDWLAGVRDNTTVTIGKTEITEEVAEKMVALIDLIEGMDDDAQLKQMFETQVSMNKIRGENGDS